jgi:hypothetical protein
MSIRILNTKTNLETVVPTFMMDNNEAVIKRIAVSLETTKKYLYFIDGIPQSFENDIVIQVENLLETIVSAESFTSLYRDIENKISQKDLSIKTDIIEPFIAFNKSYERIPSELLGSVLLPTQLEIESLNIIDKRDIDLLDIWRKRRLIIERITSSINVTRTNAIEEERINRNFEETKVDRNYTDFELEKIEFQVNLESPKITITELFNDIVLTEQVPFATINHIYKVINEFIPDPNWLTSLENVILLKLKDNKEYSNCFITLENNPEINKTQIKISLTATVSKQKEDIKNIAVQNILNIFMSKSNLSVVSFVDTKIKGLFYYPLKSLNKFVLSDLIMNNKLFSKFLFVDESVKASKKSESLYVHFNSTKTGEVTANIAEKYSFKGDPNLRGKDIINIFPYKSYYLRIKVTSINNIESVALFQDILTKILKLYEDNYQSVFDFYKSYIPSFGEKEEPNIIIKPPKLKDLAPEVFVNGYPPTCPHQPTIIDDSEIKDAESEGKQIMRYPKESDVSDNFQTRNYICNHDTAIYPGLRSNPLSNNDVIPYLPCCYEKNHSEIQGTEYRQYFFGDEPKNKFKFQQELIITNKFVGRDTFGTLPEALDRIFNIINNDRKYLYVRMGVTDSKSSFLECVLQALYEQTGILKQKSDKNRIKFLKQYRNQLANNKFLNISRQEMFDYNIDQIKEKVKDENQYFDPRFFLPLLEKIYKCNIYVFNRRGLLLPRFEKKYFNTKISSNNNLFIYQHRGSKNERATYDRCELIVKWDTTGENVDYSEPNTTILSRKMKEIFNDIVKTYSFNTDIETATFNYFSDAYIGQGIDSYGKTIMLKFNYGDQEGTLLTSPMQPLPIPEIKNWTINEINLDLALHFLEQINIESKMVKKIVQNTINDLVENITCTIGDISVTIPIESARPKRQIAINTVVKANNLYNKTTSINNIFNRNKKMARYISEYVLWLFSRSIRNTTIEILNSLSVPFIQNNIQVDESFKYPDNIEKTFSIDSPLIRSGKLVVKSEEIKKRLLYYLKLQLKRDEDKIRNYHLVPSIENYYVDVTDFDRREGQIMIAGKDSLQNWIVEKISKLDTFTNSIKFGIDTPYFFKNNMISNKIYIAQNTDSIEKAVKVAMVWDEGNGINIGNNFEVQDVTKVNYTLYSYRNESEIKKYKINSDLDKTNIKIIGYKYDDYPFYTTLLSY